jgi:hypothetical protein
MPRLEEGREREQGGGQEGGGGGGDLTKQLQKLKELHMLDKMNSSSSCDGSIGAGDRDEHDGINHRRNHSMDTMV